MLWDQDRSALRRCGLVRQFTQDDLGVRAQAGGVATGASERCLPRQARQDAITETILETSGLKMRVVDEVSGAGEGGGGCAGSSDGRSCLLRAGVAEVGAKVRVADGDPGIVAAAGEDRTGGRWFVPELGG